MGSGDLDVNRGSIYQAVKAAIRSGDLEQAHQLLRQMIDRDGSKPELWLLLAWTAPNHRAAQNIHKVLVRQYPDHPAVGQGVSWSGKEWSESASTQPAELHVPGLAPVIPSSAALPLPVLQDTQGAAAGESPWMRLMARFTRMGFFTYLMLYMLGIILAEVTTTFVSAYLGLVIHGVLLVLILLHTSLGNNTGEKKFLMTMALAPLIRLMSLSMPLLQFEFKYWYMLIGIPLLVSAMVVYRLNKYQPNQIGLALGKKLPLQFAVAVAGIGLGFLEYLILRPEPLAESFTLQDIWLPALILLVFTGFLEEFIFRGLMQHASMRTLKRWGLWYISLLFAVLHIGYQSLTDLAFVFLVGFLFSLIVARTQSLLGVTLAHGLTNISLFLIFPFMLLSPVQPGEVAALPPIQIEGPAMWSSPATQTPRPTEQPIATPVEADNTEAVVIKTIRPADTETATPTVVWMITYPAAPTYTEIPTSTGTNTPLPLASQTPIPSFTATALPSPTENVVPTVTGTYVPTATEFVLPTATQTVLPSATPTLMPTATQTLVPGPTSTTLPTATRTPLPTVTEAPTPTVTRTPLPTVTEVPTLTALPTATETALPTATETGIPTLEPTATDIPD